MKAYQFTTKTQGVAPEYLVFVDDSDETSPEEYARPDYTLYATAENVDLGRILPGEGDCYVIER